MPNFLTSNVTKNICIEKLKRVGFYLCMATLLCGAFSNSGYSSDRPFNNSSNWGGTGLLEMPNARVLEEGVMRFGFAQAEPYRWYSGAMGVLPRLEFGGRITEILNVTVNDSPGYGNYKDKAFDIKFQVLKESKYLPALSVGANDFHGTQLLASEYIVLSRRLLPFDFTFGFGTKRMSGGADTFGIDDFGPFGGIEWKVSNRINLMAEYSPIQYEKDDFVYGIPIPEKAPSPINIGARAEIFRGVDLGVSWQRGDTIGVLLHFNLKLGKSILPKRPNPPAWRTLEPESFARGGAADRINMIKDEIKKAGFDNINVYTDGRTLTAEFQNERYISNQKAAGRVLRILLKQSPPEIDSISAVLTRHKIPFLRISVAPDDFDRFLMGNMRQDIFEQLVTVETVSEKTIKKGPVLAESEKDNRLDYRWGVKPEFEPFLNDLSGAFRFRVGIKPYASVSPWKGGTFAASYMIPFYSNVHSVKTPPPDAVRSDGWLYLQEDPSPDRLLFDQTLRLGSKTLGRLSTGYFEKEYAGVGGEIMTFPWGGSFAFGMESDWVRKRVPGNTLELYTDKGYYTAIGNVYYRFKPLKMTLRAQYGRFLGEDTGWRFEASREYDTGLVVGAWYSFTDTDHFSTEWNRGYHDKGIFMRLPAQMFSLRETRTRYSYRVAPWTRDVAATVAHPSTLYNTAADLMPALFGEKLGRIKD
ncbi:MAG: YjbH domain-containing protein [Desulfobacteraceae bacterium]|nr:YjbH domain-containing protein [Desulfobacteraceae bacterium]